MRTKSKFLSILLTLALILGMLPWTTLPARAAAVKEWTKSDYLPYEAGSYKLMTDVTLSAYWSVPRDAATYQYITLDLNGHGIKSTAQSAIMVYENYKLTLTDSNPTAQHDPEVSYTDPITSEVVPVVGGYITCDNSNASYTVFVSGTFIMRGGTIYGATSTYNGGGVCVSGGKGSFYMGDTAKVAGNTAINGGGVYVEDSATFTIDSGTITGNTATNGGGVYVEDSATFMMNYTAQITGNTATNGGGVYVEDSGKLTMGGTAQISGNTATAQGGGVYVAVEDNEAASFLVSGGATVTGNKLGGTFENGVLTGGTANNVYLAKDGGKSAVITVTDTLTGTFGVTLADGYTGAFTSGLPDKGAATNFTSDNGAYRLKLTEGNEAKLLQPAAKIGTTEYETFDEAVGNWTDGTTLTLLADVETDSTITVGDGTNATSVTLDLNDHGIRAKASYSENPTLNRTFRVFRVSGGAKLTLEDTAASRTTRYITLSTTAGGSDKVHGTAVSAVKPAGEAGTDYLAVSGGYVTGGLAYNNSNGADCDGGAVYVDSNGTFIMNGGTLAGNVALTGNGGGVYVGYESVDVGEYVGGTFTMGGGTISGNKAWECGGGVYVAEKSTFTMSGSAEISGNKADVSGGGVYANYSTFHMEGGTITGNTSTGNGGGVNVNGTDGFPCRFTMSGGTICGNTGTGGGVYVNTNSTFAMSGNAKVSGNTSTGNGGGVLVDGAKALLTMSDNAEISKNKAGNNHYGGGVYIMAVGAFTMDGGTISGNTAYGGGGVGLYTGTVTMNGGTITGNNVTYRGGGVYVVGGTDRTFQVSGGATVTGNKLGGAFEDGVLTGGTANNVYLDTNMTITVTGELTGELGVSMDTPGVFTDTAAENTAWNDVSHFTSDSASYLTGLDNDGQAKLLASSFSDDGKVTAPKGATLVCATYKNGQMTAVQTVTLDANCIGESAATLLGKESLPVGCKLFLLAKGTYAPLCAAWSN